MRRTSTGFALLLVLAAFLPAGAAEIVSKRYEFKAGVTLDLGVDTAEGMRLDSVKFLIPLAADGTHVRTGGRISAEVAVSNESNVSRQVGLALALFDPEGRLVGVASGGSRVLPLKPSRQKTYKLVFSNVNALADRATTFQISLESE